jgi:hypothetical protein
MNNQPTDNVENNEIDDDQDQMENPIGTEIPNALKLITDSVLKETVMAFLGVISAPEDAIMYLDAIHTEMCSMMEFETNIPDDNPFVDSPSYQRDIISETLLLLFSLDQEKLVLAHELISGAFKHAYEYDDSSDEDEDDPDEDSDDSDSDDDEDEDDDGGDEDDE